MLLILISSKLIAQPGALDMNYGTSGVAAFDFSENNALTYVTLIQPDGKALLAGSALNNGSPVFAIARFNPDGSSDSTFGAGGGLTTNIDTSTIYAIALQPLNGEIVVAGFSQDSIGKFALARYTTGGVPDSTFGSGGIITTSIKGVMDMAAAVAIQPDGKILAGGISEDSTGKWYFAVARYLANGTLDGSFNGNGLVTTLIDTGGASLAGLLLQTDGSIILAGNSISGGIGHPVLVRYTSSGGLDNTFGSNGIVNSNLAQSDNRINSAVLQPDGKIVVGGYALSMLQVFALARFNSDGSLDNTFGNSGIVLNATGTSDNVITSLVLQPDKKIIATGSMDDTLYTLILNRYLSNGSLDTSFGAGGVQTSTLFAPDTLLNYSSALQPDGNLVVSGAAFNGNNLDFAASRFLTALPATCSAFFTVYPGTNNPNQYFVFNQATGFPPLTYEWSWGDGSFSFGDSASHTYSEPDYFNICLDVTDSLGCASSYCNGTTYISAADSAEPININSVNNGPAGIDDLPAGASVNIYPNPTEGKVLIQCANFAPEWLTVYDINGNKLFEQHYTLQENLSAATVDLNSLPGGIYLVEVIGSDGIAIRKVVKD